MNFNKYGRTAQLFDYQTMSDGLVGSFLNSDGTITTNAASSSWTITKYIPVAGREFTLQRQASGGATSICLYDSNQTYITGLAYNGNGTVTVSANTDVSYIRFTYYRTENTGNIMLNEGSTAKPFEPYGNTWHDTPHYIMGTSTDTITTLPADIYPNAVTATVGLKGNTTQNGTPTPDNPVMPQGTGDKTANLFDASILANNKSLNSNGVVVDITGRIATITPIDVSDYTSVTLSYTSNSASFMFATFNGTTLVERTAAKPSGATIDVTNCDTLYISFYKSSSITTDDVTEIMLNTGSTAKPYEPYGIKIPILSGGVTTNAYLGEIASTRKVYKWVLTGEEDWLSAQADATKHYLATVNPDYLRANTKATYLSSHYVAYEQTTSASLVPDGCFAMASNTESQRLYISDSNYNTDTDFKTFLAQQYAAGTPVCVWYVLATPTTGIVNEPLRKIGTYADEVSGITIPTIAGANTLSIGTTLQPSEVTATYKGWHPVADVHEYDSNYTIATMQALTIAQLQTHTISDLQEGGWS